MTEFVLAVLAPGTGAFGASATAKLRRLLAVRSRKALPVVESALAGATALTVVLAAGVVVVLRQGTRASCPCFGASSARPLGIAHLIRNGCLLAVLAASLIGSHAGRGYLGPASAALASVTGLVAGMLFVRWDDLASLAGRSPAAGQVTSGPGPPRRAQPAPGRPDRRRRETRRSRSLGHPLPRWPSTSRNWLIKRVAALPCDPWPAQPGSATASSAGHAGPPVPAGRFVVLGDNPGGSYDSRVFGYCPANRLLGMVIRWL